MTSGATTILAIKTSCDETGVGIARLDGDGTVTLPSPPSRAMPTPVSSQDVSIAKMVVTPDVIKPPSASCTHQRR